MSGAMPDPRLDGVSLSRQGLWSAIISLLASSSTLVCCAIPALLVALGAGAVLSSLVSVVPQIVWLSEHKEGLFIFAACMMVLGGGMLWRNRTAPCPIDSTLRNACLRTRKVSARMYLVSVLCFALGGWFAFVQPWLSGLG